MKPVKQNILHDPDNGIWGNCYPACIASILELPLVEIPHFQMFDESWGGYEKRIEEFIKSQGYKFTEYRMLQIANILQNGHNSLDGYIMMSGESPRSKVKHSILYKDFENWHDPHPDNLGIMDIYSITVAERT